VIFFILLMVQFNFSYKKIWTFDSIARLFANGSETIKDRISKVQLEINNVYSAHAKSTLKTK